MPWRLVVVGVEKTRCLYYDVFVSCSFGASLEIIIIIIIICFYYYSALYPAKMMPWVGRNGGSSQELRECSQVVYIYFIMYGILYRYPGAPVPSRSRISGYPRVGYPRATGSAV